MSLKENKTLVSINDLLLKIEEDNEYLKTIHDADYEYITDNLEYALTFI